MADVRANISFDELNQKEREAAAVTLKNIGDRYLRMVKESLGEKFPPPSKPDEPPKRRTGKLIDEMINSVSTDGVSRSVGPRAMGPRSHIARLLELGTRYIKPRPFLRPALLKLGRDKNIDSEVEKF